MDLPEEAYAPFRVIKQTTYPTRSIHSVDFPELEEMQKLKYRGLI